MPANGIRFDPKGDSGETFQVTFTGEDDAVFTADISEGAAEDPFDFGGTTAPPPATGGGSGGGFSSPDLSPVEPPAIEPPTDDAPAAPPATEDRPTEERATLAANRAGETFGNWPLSVLVALVGGLLLALLAAWSLGSGRPVEAAVRPQRGVSRALAARTRLTRSEESL